MAHTAGTRAAAERAKAELASRHADDVTPEPAVTASEWLEAHRAAQADDDARRDIIDTDLDDHGPDAPPEEAAAPKGEVDDADEPHVEPVVKPAQDDLREIAASEPAPVEEDNVRVPSADETSTAVERANRALGEMRARDEMDAKEDAEHRAEQLATWQANDSVADDIHQESPETSGVNKPDEVDA